MPSHLGELLGHYFSRLLRHEEPFLSSAAQATRQAGQPRQVVALPAHNPQGAPLSASEKDPAPFSADHVVV